MRWDLHWAGMNCYGIGWDRKICPMDKSGKSFHGLLLICSIVLLGPPVLALRIAHRLCDLSTLAGVEVFCFVVPQTKDF